MNHSTLLRGLAVAVLATGCRLTDVQARALPHGVFAFSGIDSTPAGALYQNPSVAGVTLATRWSALEPAPGQFDWSALDAKVATAARAGRQVALSVTPGVFTPAWVYALGASRLNVKWTLPWGFVPCSTVSFPLPWDPVYGAAWSQFVAAFGQHYAGNPAVTLVKVTGVNAATAELVLPYSVAGQVPARDVQCGNAPVALLGAWKAAGYRPSKVAAAWNQFATAFAESFPTQQLVAQIGSGGLPPIDESGNVTPGSAGDIALPRALTLAGLHVAGDRFALENDGLSAGWNWARPPWVPAAAPLAYQAASAVTDDATCRMNRFVAPCDPATVMRAAIARANIAGAEFVEVYTRDLLNPALAPAVAAFAD